MKVLSTFAFALALVINVAAGMADTIRVAAAISMKDALGEIVKTYEKESADKIEFIFGASGQLQQQIETGSDVDLFLSAANKQVNALVKGGHAIVETRRDVVHNSLVLVVPADAKDSPAGFADLADAKVKKLAIGEPATVPAGQYASQLLKALKIDTAVADRIVYGMNVRQVLTYVELGEVSAGIVYASDAKESGNKVRVVATADAKLHEPIVYPGIVLTASKKQDAAKRFLDYLTKPAAQDVFTSKGFQAVAEQHPSPATQAR